MPATQEQLLAFALYEIRLLLAHYLGSGEDTDPSVRAAAHLAYALHNQASVALQGGEFDPAEAISALGAVDRLLETDFQERLASSLASQCP